MELRFTTKEQNELERLIGVAVLATKTSKQPRRVGITPVLPSLKGGMKFEVVLSAINAIGTYDTTICEIWPSDTGIDGFVMKWNPLVPKSLCIEINKKIPQIVLEMDTVKP